MRLTVHYGNQPVNFELVRKNVKHINLTVHPDQTISVSANERVSIAEIKAFVQSKGRWIKTKLNYFQRTAPFEKLPRDYVTGETFRYLGRQYRLKVIESVSEYVRFFRGTIEMYVRDKQDLSRKKQLLEKWYEERREIVFIAVLQQMYKRVKFLNINCPTLDIRHMKLRWGSYLPQQHKILLNKDLIIAPRFCIGYAVLHELLHTKLPDHGYHFLNQLQLRMPDWQERKRILDEEVAREV